MVVYPLGSKGDSDHFSEGIAGIGLSECLRPLARGATAQRRAGGRSHQRGPWPEGGVTRQQANHVRRQISELFHPKVFYRTHMFMPREQQICVDASCLCWTNERGV